jgi:heptosyltransferase-2
MGDVIMSACLFGFLKQKFSDIEIHFLTLEKYTGLFTDDSRLASVSAADESSVFPALSALQWDGIIDLQNSRRSRRITSRWFSTVPARRFNKLHLHRILLLATRLNLYSGENNVVTRYISTVEPSFAGTGAFPPVRLYFSGDSASIKHNLFGIQNANRLTLALIPFSAWKNKQWPLDSFTAVGKTFAAKGWNIAIMGGPDDRGYAQALKNSIGEGAEACAGDISLHDAGCLFSACDLALGVDTGLSHLARACNVRTGVVFGATTWHFGFFPSGQPAFRIFESRRFCRPCHAHGGNFCWRLTRPCLSDVSVETVIKGLEDLNSCEKTYDSENSGR